MFPSSFVSLLIQENSAGCWHNNSNCSCISKTSRNPENDDKEQTGNKNSTFWKEKNGSAFCEPKAEFRDGSLCLSLPLFLVKLEMFPLSPFVLVEYILVIFLSYL